MSGKAGIHPPGSTGGEFYALFMLRPRISHGGFILKDDMKRCDGPWRPLGAHHDRHLSAYPGLRPVRLARCLRPGLRPGLRAPAVLDLLLSGVVAGGLLPYLLWALLRPEDL